MKEIIKKWKILPIVFAVIILLQGCTVYKKSSVTLQEAAKDQIKTKVETKNGNLFFKYITYENNLYYGVNRSKGELEKIRLDSEYIKNIHLKNKKASVLVSIIIPVGVIIGAILMLGSIALST